MTWKLCKLAAGRVVVALEVCLRVYFEARADGDTGRLQLGVYIKVCCGGCPGTTWRATKNESASGSESIGSRGNMAGIT